MNRKSIGCMAVLLGTLAACGAAEETPQVPITVAAPTPVAACLTFVIEDQRPAGENEYERRIRADVREAFEQELTRAGFTVVYNDSYPHDAVLRLATQPGSAVAEGAHVESVLSVDGELGPVTQIRADALQKSQTYAYDVGKRLVDALFQKPELGSFARELRRPNAERVEARLVAEHQAAVEKALQAGPEPPPPAPSPTPVAAPVAAPPPGPAPFLAGDAQPASYAIVVGIGQYADGHTAPGARADAERFVRLAKTTLGVPEKQITLAVDEGARRADIEALVSWMKLGSIAGSRIYVFFSGLGFARQHGPTFIMPFDADAKSPEKSGLRLFSLLHTLSATRAKEIIAFVDTSNAGVGARSTGVPEGGTTTRARDEEVPPRVTLFLGAGNGEVAGATPDGKAGLFSSYLLSGLGYGHADLDGDGQIVWNELASWVKPRVARDAKKAGQAQDPWFNDGASATPGSRLVLASGLQTF